MKHLLFYIFLFASTLTVCAQTEVNADSLSAPSAQTPENFPLTDVKEYDGFLLDMGLMQMEAPRLENYRLEVMDASKDYSRIFRLDNRAMYTQGWGNLFSLSNSIYYSSNPFGLGLGSGNDVLQVGTFRLKNGMSIRTYGQYNKDGWRMHNPSALPWERNNFKGAFELKSANGAFGIRIEVQQGTRQPF